VNVTPAGRFAFVLLYVTESWELGVFETWKVDRPAGPAPPVLLAQLKFEPPTLTSFGVTFAG
jgi:hypothetical protein